MYSRSVDTIDGPQIAVGNKQARLSGMPSGVLHGMWVQLLFTIISTAGAFNALVTGGGVEGDTTHGDDIDRILSTFLGSIRWDLDPESPYLPAALTLPRLRRLVAWANGHRDVELVGIGNGVSVPAAGGGALSSEIWMHIPLSLASLIDWGDVFAQGSERVKRGSMWFNILSTGTNVTLNNGTGTLAGMGINLWPNYDKDGSPTRIGPTIEVTDLPNLNAKKPDLDPAARLASFITDPTLTGNFRADGPVTFRAATRSLLVKQYQRDNDLTSKDYDITGAWTPLIAPTKRSRFHDLPASRQSLSVVNEGGQATSYLDIQVHALDLGAFENSIRSSQVAAGPDGYHVGRVLPGGMTPGYQTPAALTGYMPAEAAAGAPPRAGLLHLSTPADVHAAVVAAGPLKRRVK